MVKIIVSQEQYDKVRKIEHISGRKIKEIYAPVVDCVDGQWGLWNIKRCYRSLEKYIADVELDEKAENQQEAIRMWKMIQTIALMEMVDGNPNVGQVIED